VRERLVLEGFVVVGPPLADPSLVEGVVVKVVVVVAFGFLICDFLWPWYKIPLDNPNDW
jgi:hypothetical protein